MKIDMITAENAKNLALLSAAKRRENAAKFKEVLEINSGLTAFRDAQLEESTVFRTSVHARIRKQIESLLKMLEKASEPKEVEQLSRSLSTLMEQDRIMSGIPLPGTLRPSKEKPKRATEVAPDPS